MKRWMLGKIALILALSVLLPTALVAVADAPEALEIEFDGIELEMDGTGEDLLLDGGEVTIEDGTLILDDGLGDDLLSDDLLDIQLSEESLTGAADASGLGLQSDDAGLSVGAEETIGSVTTSGGMDNDALFEVWMARALPGMASLQRNASARSGRASLSGLNRKLYDALVPMIKEVANGSRTSTKLTIDDAAAGLSDSWWTAEQLGVSLSDGNLGKILLAKEGFDQTKIMQALLADCPYELYWFDKVTGGMGWSFNKTFKTENNVKYARLTGLTANMAVAVSYSKADKVGTYEVNDLPQQVSAAVDGINSVIAENRDKDDLSKLRAYANAICSRVAYNRDAASNTNTPYGDPWQLVYIFDGDAATNVVCEGYSKAFKYLCDLSDFDGDVYVELMNGTIPAGNHMWNAVRMPDGRCYLVDLTNSDGGDACNEKYFLKACKDQTASGFTCGTLTYTYNNKTLAMFSGDWLTMSGADYGKGYAVTTSATNGTLSANVQTANAGETVTLTVTAETGFAAAAPAVRSGDRSIDVAQAGSGQWRFTMPCGDVTASAKCTLIYAVNGWSGVYDGKSHGISVSTAANVTVTYGTASGAYNLTQSPGWKDAGAYTAYYCVRSAGAVVGEGQASVTISPKTVGLDWSGTEVTYNGETQQPAASATDLVGGDACSVVVTGGRRDAGTYTATATGLSNGNYALPGSITRAFTIAPKPVGLSWSDPGLTYNGEIQQPTASATGLVGGDACSVVVIGGQRDAGAYTAMATGLSNGNYALSGDVARAFTIAPRTAELVWDVNLTYNGAAQSPSVAVGNLASGDECRVAVSGEGRDAGAYTATVTGLSNGNYALPGDLTRAFTIAPKTVGLKWSKTSVIYNGKVQKPKLTLKGIEPGDVCTVTMKGSRKNAGNFTAKATKLSNANYALPAIRTKVCTIRKRTVKLKWSKTRLKYNGKSQKPTATATGLIKGDKCTVTVSGAKKKRGTYTARATKLSNKNYQLPTKATVKFKIY